MNTSILILEDDFDLAQQWRDALNAAHMDVYLVSNFEQAVLACKQREFDAFVVDVFLKNDKGELASQAGLTFLSALRTGLRDMPEWGKEVPILMVSGAAVVNNFDVLELTKNLGSTEVLRKPFGPSKLAEVLKDLISSNTDG